MFISGSFDLLPLVNLNNAIKIGIDGTSLRNLQGLENLEYVEKEVIITQNKNLELLTNFDNGLSVETFELVGNESLRDYSQLLSLENIRVKATLGLATCLDPKIKEHLQKAVAAIVEFDDRTMEERLVIEESEDCRDF